MEIRERRWDAFIFGGTLRDLAISGPNTIPRDVDIVVDNVTVDEIRRVMAPHVRRATRFGGLHLEADGWLVDIWPLRDTWAFREKLVSAIGFAALPRTTFLNVEAVAMRLPARPGRERRVCDHRFFEAILSREIEINLEENPFPALCVVRSLVTAARLGFQIGPKLASYIDHHAQSVSVEELMDIQVAHYGRVRSNADELHNWLEAVHQGRRCSKRRPVRLPVHVARQLELWSDTQATR